MERYWRPGAIGFVTALVAVVLAAGVLSAIAVGRAPGTGASDARVGAAALDQSALAEEAARAREAAEVTVAPRPATPTATPGPGATTAGPAAVGATATSAPRGQKAPGATTPTVPPGAPPPGGGANGGAPPGIPNLAPAAAWSNVADGVTARMRIEPAAPVAGAPVRFTVDASSADPCCVVMLSFGDGDSAGAASGPACPIDPPMAPGARSTVVSHTFAGPGAYKVTLTVWAGNPCPGLPPGPGAPPSLPVIHAVEVPACVGVGPGTAGQGGCSPFPTAAPGQLISPVLDPFCQIRSDCTQASPAR